MNENTMNKKLDEMDGVLTRFFRAEMPDPWPECRIPASPRQPASRPWVRSMGRFTLAASLLLFFVGYVGLAGLFSARTPGVGVDHRHVIGKGFEKTQPQKLQKK